MVVGIGLNVVLGMLEKIVEKVFVVYGYEFMVKINKFFGLVNYFGLNVVYGVLKILVVDMFKIV